MQSLTPKQKKALQVHSKHHSKKHMAEMRSTMRAGKSFDQAHTAAQKKAGK
jgi:hypothetical protein